MVLASFLQPTVGEGHQFLLGRQTALITLTGRQLLHVSKRRRICCVKSEMARSTMTFHPSHDSLVSLLDVSRFLFLFLVMSYLTFSMRVLKTTCSFKSDFILSCSRSHLLHVCVSLLQDQMASGTGRWWMPSPRSRTLAST